MSDPTACPLQQLHPTQLTLGMREVHDKQRELAKLDAAGRDRLLRDHPFPCVVGPAGRLYLTDHHHLGRAALEAGATGGYAEIIGDLSKLPLDRFWPEMDDRGWVHPLDEHGERHRYASIPAHLDRLVDDPYRSLARYARAGGAYEKSTTAFAEFEWADFFRRLIPVEDLAADFGAAIEAAVRLARGKRAAQMPGYRPGHG